VKIFVDISFKTSLQRALSRDLDLLGSRETVTRNYQQRYIPWAETLFFIGTSQNKADIIIDNNDFHNPRITFTKL
jgi:uridine kinase